VVSGCTRCRVVGESFEGGSRVVGSVTTLQQHSLETLRWVRRWLSDVRWLYRAATHRRGATDSAAPLQDM
jgi:hypothetical protein